MRLLSASLLCLTLPVFAQRPVTFEGRAGLQLSNDKLELTILTHGGAFAELVLRDDPGRMNPMWNPARLAREAGLPAPTSFSFGHFVCVDGFGPVSSEERAAGLPGHGEAHTLPWSTRRSDPQSVTFSVRLPLVQEVFTRTVRLAAGENVVLVESELENLLAFDRPINWAEHGTIGSPFLEPEKTVVDMPAARSKTRAHPVKPRPLPLRLASFQDFTWPMAPTTAGGTVDVRFAPRNPGSMDHTTNLMDPSQRLAFVAALHTEQRLLLGYLFRREEFPWIQTWDNYQPTLKMARGLEFSTQPFDVPRREAIGTGTMFDAPTYRWLPAKSKIGSRFLMFYTRTPEGFTKVDEVKLEGGNLVLVDRKAGKQVVLKASFDI